jgi:hypothetical protein
MPVRIYRYHFGEKNTVLNAGSYLQRTDVDEKKPVLNPGLYLQSTNIFRQIKSAGTLNYLSA